MVPRSTWTCLVDEALRNAERIGAGLIQRIRAGCYSEAQLWLLAKCGCKEAQDALGIKLINLARFVELVVLCERAGWLQDAQMGIMDALATRMSKPSATTWVSSYRPLIITDRLRIQAAVMNAADASQVIEAVSSKCGAPRYREMTKAIRKRVLSG